MVSGELEWAWSALDSKISLKFI